MRVDIPGAVALATLATGHLAKTGQLRQLARVTYQAASSPHPTGSRADVLMLGPLTNLALALRLYPLLAESLGRVFIMGGATTARGTVQRSEALYPPTLIALRPCR